MVTGYEGVKFDEALAKAQELGFAEADPSADVDRALANIDDIAEVALLRAAGATDSSALAAAIDETTFAVAVQSPNFRGVIEDWGVATSAAHEHGPDGPDDVDLVLERSATITAENMSLSKRTSAHVAT